MNKITHGLLSFIAALTLALGGYHNARASTEAVSLQSGIAYYVSANGSDTNACTNNAPCKTFNKVISLAQPGDIIQILPGTYTQTLTVSKSDLTIVGNGAVIDAQGLQYGVILSGKNLTLSGIVVKNSKSHAIYVIGQNIRVADNEIYNSVLECISVTSICGSALKVGPPGDGIILENNYVHNNKSEGIAVTMGKNTVVRNNRVSNNFAVEIYIDNSPNARVGNNHVFCNQTGSTAIAFDEEMYSGWGQQLSNLYVGRNTITGCKYGLGYWATQGGIKTALIEYNTFNDIKTSAMYFANGNNTNVVITHNIFPNTQPWFDGKTGITIDNNFWVSTKPASFTGALGPNDKSGTPLFAVAPVWTDPNTFKQLSTSPACGYGRWDCDGSIPTTATPTASVAASFTPTSTLLPSPTPTWVPTNPPATFTVVPPSATSLPSTPILPSPTPIWVPTNPPATFTLVPPSATSLPPTPTWVPTNPPPTFTLVTPPTSVPTTATSTAVPLTATSQSPTLQPIPEVVYDDLNGGFVYSPNWQGVPDQQSYGSSYKITTGRRATVSFGFTGQSFSIIYVRGPNYRNMDVYVDGVLAGTIRQRALKMKYQQRWDYPGQLAPGSHTLELVIRNKPDTYCSLDAVIVR